MRRSEVTTTQLTRGEGERERRMEKAMETERGRQVAGGEGRGRLAGCDCAGSAGPGPPRQGAGGSSLPCRPGWHVLLSMPSVWRSTVQMGWSGEGEPGRRHECAICVFVFYFIFTFARSATAMASAGTVETSFFWTEPRFFGAQIAYFFILFSCFHWLKKLGTM